MAIFFRMYDIRVYSIYVKLFITYIFISHLHILFPSERGAKSNAELWGESRPTVCEVERPNAESQR